MPIFCKFTIDWTINLNGDVNAANVVFDSNVELWQVPCNIYSMMKVSFQELYEKVSGCGKIGKYLYENLLRVNNKLCSIPLFGGMATYPGGESWQLGDSPVVGLLMTDRCYDYNMVPAPRVDEEGHYHFVERDMPSFSASSFAVIPIMEPSFDAPKYFNLLYI